MSLTSDSANKLLQLMSRFEDLKAERESNRRRKKQIVILIVSDLRKEYIQWFEKEAEIVEKIIDILEQVIPDEDYNEEKSILMDLKNRHSNAKDRLENILTSIERERIETFSDISVSLLNKTKPFGEEYEGGIIPEILGIGQELEKLVNNLEQHIKYLSYARRINEIIQASSRDS